MATLEQLQRALVNADAAGDTEGATILAREIQSMQGQQQTQPAGNQFDPTGGASDAFLNSAWQAATLGFGDELVAGGLVPFEMASRAIKGQDWSPGASYDATLAEQRRQIADAEQNHPIANIGGSVAGALTGMQALGPLVSSPFSARVASSAPVWQKVAAGAGDGFGMGMAYGYGSGEGEDRPPAKTWAEWAYGIPSDVGSRLSNAAVTGAVGGAVGAAAPAVSSVIGKGYEVARDALRSRPIAASVGASPDALRILSDLGGADDVFGPRGAAEMAKSGQEAMLANAGPSSAQFLKTAVQNSGPAARLATDRIGQRMDRETKALVDALDLYLGTPEGVTAAQKTIRDTARPGVNQAYEVAENMPIDYASEAGKKVEDIINRIPNRYKAKAIERANERFAYDGKQNLQIMADIADDGTVAFREMPNVAQADAIKRALDEVVRDGTELGGKMSSDAQFANKMAKDLRNAVGDAVPEYKAALATAADPLSRQSAIETGASLLSDTMKRDQARMVIDGMTPAENIAAKQGLRSRFDDVMAAVKRTRTDDDVAAREAYKAVSELSSRANREKMTMLLGEDEANALLTEADRVAQTFKLKSDVAQRSDTFANFAMDQRVKDVNPVGPLKKLARGEGLNSAKGAIQTLTGETDAAQRARSDKVYYEIADILTRQGVDAPAFLNAITQMTSTDAATQQAKQSIIRALSGPQISYPASIAAGQWQQR